MTPSRRAQKFDVLIVNGIYLLETCRLDRDYLLRGDGFAATTSSLFPGTGASGRRDRIGTTPGGYTKSRVDRRAGFTVSVYVDVRISPPPPPSRTYTDEGVAPRRNGIIVGAYRQSGPNSRLRFDERDLSRVARSRDTRRGSSPSR